MKNLISFAFCTLVLSFAFCALRLSASALTMSDSNYILQMGNLNMASGNISGSGKNLSFTMGQTAPGLYSKDGVNYKVRSGFQYIHSIIPFYFQIENIFIDFGTIVPTDPVTRTSNLIVANGSAHGYTVTAYENHQLLIPASGALIPNTTCDNGLCTETTSDLWNNNLTYGFGYRCDNVAGTECPIDFLPPTYTNYYKHFADNSQSDMPQTVMSGLNVGKKTSKEVTITYKINISQLQPAGLYSNVITYIATPTY